MTHKINYIYSFRSILIIICILLCDVFFILRKAYAFKQGSVEVINNNLEMLPLYWTIGIIGGCIALTLIFVSWRKYKAEKKKKMKKKSYH